MTDFILPDIGEGIVECELLKWHVAVGDLVKEDQAVAEVMTDKATVEIPSMYNGIVSKLYFNEGEIAKVHKPLFALEASDLVDHNKNTNNPMPNLENENSQKKNIESFVLPDIGEGIVECEIVEWLVAEGDSVKEDQPICDVMTDKALVQIPAVHDGVISKLYYAKGDIALASEYNQIANKYAKFIQIQRSIAEGKLWDAIYSFRMGEADKARTSYNDALQHYDYYDLAKEVSFHEASSEYMELLDNREQAIEFRRALVEQVSSSASIYNQMLAHWNYCRILGRFGKPMETALADARSLGTKSLNPSIYLQKLDEIEAGQYWEYAWQKDT